MNERTHFRASCARRTSRKRARVLAEHNQYVFEVAARREKADVKAAVEAMFNVKVVAVNLVNVKSKTSRSAPAPAAAGLAQGLRAPFRRPDHRRDGKTKRRASRESRQWH